MTLQPFIFAAVISLGASAIAGCDDSTAAVPPVMPPPEAATVSLDWQQRTGSLVAASRLNPLAAGRVYAAVSVAQYRAARAANNGPVVPDAPYEARLGAIVGASVQVLSFFFPAAADSLSQLLTGVGTGAGIVQAEYARGVAMGRRIGDELIERVKQDGFTRAWDGNVQSGAGIWTPVAMPPAGITLASVTPWFLQSPAQFRPTPPAFGSVVFNTDLDEVLQYSKHRTPEQLAQAKAWDYGAGTTTAVGYWNQTAADYVAQNGMDELGATLVLALMHAAVFDAQIACWDAKYHYWMLRPYQANAEIATALAPPNHPAFPSGHSCVSAAAARVLQEFFPHRTNELDQLVSDAGMSRIYAGIHYRFDITAGQQLGRTVADWAINHGSL